MREREEQRQRDIQTDVDIGEDVAIDDDVETVIDETLADSRTEKVSEESGVRERLSSPVSKRGLAIAFLLSAGCMLAFGFLLPLGQLLGLFVGGFVYGLATDRRRYVELLLSGLVAGGVWTLIGNVGLAVVGGLGMLPLLVVGLVGGGLAALVGHYFGRDFRDGLTREV